MLSKVRQRISNKKNNVVSPAVSGYCPCKPYSFFIFRLFGKSRTQLSIYTLFKASLLTAIFFFSAPPSTRPKIIDIFRKSSELHRFPAFCGVIIGGWHVLQPIFEKCLGTVGKFSESLGAEKTTGEQRRRVATFLASASAAAVAIRQLNGRSVESPAGRTLDLTLFAVVRALDVVIGEIWTRRKAHQIHSKTFTRLDRIIEDNASAAIFATSAAVIMFSWFYEPERLPS